MKKCIGVLGGMGPEATLLMFSKIISRTPATKDQEHLEVIVHNNTRVPDRTRGILYNGESPYPEILRSAEKLQAAGADVIVMPCMTAHYFHQEVSEKITIPFLNAIRETAEHIHDQGREVHKVGLLATTGTLKSRLFQTELQKCGIEALCPPQEEQESLVMEAIYGAEGVKSGSKSSYASLKLREAGRDMIKKGARAIILGCTEVPIAVGQDDFDCMVVDPMDVLADSAIHFALGR